MPEISREKFREFWRKTEVIREYHRTLYTFGDARLPYVFAAEHPRLSDRAVVRKGLMLVQKPHILLPEYYGPQFAEGFEQVHTFPSEAIYLFRSMGLPYSRISNRPAAKEQIEYGGLQSVLDKLDRQLEGQEDPETGLIKGTLEGAEVALMRYAFGLMVKSASENVREFFEHLRQQRGEPIRPDERITDEDIERLFG